MKDFDALLNANIVRNKALFSERMVILSAICQSDTKHLGDQWISG